MDIKVKLINGGKMPEYAHVTDACADCFANIPDGALFKIPVGKRAKVPLGFALELPLGYEAVLRPRSGNGAKGIDIVEGTIDSGYRGELMASVVNNTEEPLVIANGAKIVQMKIQVANQFNFIAVDELAESDRGSNGFGSTGN